MQIGLYKGMVFAPELALFAEAVAGQRHGTTEEGVAIRENAGRGGVGDPNPVAL
jgi:hypothetical protein